MAQQTKKSPIDRIAIAKKKLAELEAKQEKQRKIIALKNELAKLRGK